ncbi:DUF6406 domain-containing protein [Actinomadura chokoriensis]|uniref:DUF6406 domain-containing protein n=1 Tax=Actinomadura chokoriensis TaxID=454156 RepID=UPI0031F939C9
MELDRIGLRHGRLRHLNAGTIGVVDVKEADEEGLPEVVAFVKDDGERDISLRPGDTFSIGNETWRLDHIKDADDLNWTVVFVRIE